MMSRFALTARFALGLFLVVLLASGVAHAQDPRASLAQKAALQFLALTDKNDAKASWEAAGKQFQKAITPERWKEALNDLRGPLGPTVGRTLLSTRFTDKFPGSSATGEYALLEFRASFAKRTRARETLTVEREADGVWRVIGYSIR